MSQHVWMSRIHPGPSVRRAKMGERTLVACIHCKERKQKCDGQIPACGNCQRYKRPCLVEDPATKRHHPRNYLQSLEERVAVLEAMLQEVRPEVAKDHLHSDLAVAGAPTIQTLSDTLLDSQNLGPTDLPLDMGPGNCELDRFLLCQPPPKQSRNDEAIDDMTDISSKIGLLSVNAPNAEPHFFGTSSALAMSRLINSALRRVSQEKVVQRDADHIDPMMTSYDSLLATPSPLPSAEGRELLAKSYFENIHPQYPFLHEPTFRVWERTMLENSMSDDTFSSLQPSIPFFVYMVYALGRLALPWNTAYSSERLFRSAQVYMDAVMQVNGLESIQAILCSALYSLRSCHFGSVWCLSGMALRQCIELGYHRSPKKLAAAAANQSSLQLELRKRVFWCAYDLDRSASITFGRPFGIPENEIDVEYPLDIDDTSVTQDGIRGSPRVGDNDLPTSMSGAIHMFRLHRIWSRIHTLLYAGIEDPNESVDSIDIHVAYLRTELGTWHQTIPPQSPWNKPGSSLWGSNDWFELSYHHSILLLYRSRITAKNGSDQDPSHTNVLLECSRAARDICHCYRRIYLGRPVGYTWEALHNLFLAGLTYLHCIWTSARVQASIRQDDLSNTCMACTMVLVVMAERWSAAAPYRDIFEALTAKTMSMVTDQGQQRLDKQEPNGVVFRIQEDEQDMALGLSQWLTTLPDMEMSGGMETFFTSFMEDVRPDTGTVINSEVV